VCDFFDLRFFEHILIGGHKLAAVADRLATSIIETVKAGRSPPPPPTGLI
jgi:hypothetical protein